MFFSIIIPVYNVEPYLRECLDSVLAQTFTDWETICVDDGSTDDSGVILDSYAAKDVRFKVIHKCNEGVPKARQAGLDAATGCYVCWIDADDTMDSMNLETFAREIGRSGVDFLWMDCLEARKGCTVLSRQECPQDSLEYVKRVLDGRLWASLWNKTISLDFVRRNGIRFPDGGCTIMEDVCFVINIMVAKPSMCYIPEAHYRYVMCGESLTRTGTDLEKLFARRVASEKIVQSTIRSSGLLLEKEAETRLKMLKFEMYSNTAVSDALFYGSFDDVVSLSGLHVPIWHRLFYALAVRGFRHQVLSALSLIRKMRGCKA